MRKANRFLIFSVLLAALLSSCTYRSLKNVESVMETDPAAADSLLDAIPSPRHARSRALHAILRTQIDYKLYRKAESDSLIRTATGYYGKGRKSYHAAMAWYSLGCVAGESGRDSTAADAYLTAISLFPDTLVRYYALSQQNLSYIYLDHKMDQEALPLIKSCRANAVRLGDSAAIAFCDYNIAKYHLLTNNFDTAKVLFERLVDNSWLSHDTRHYPILQLAKILQSGNHDYMKSIEYVDSFVKVNKNNVSNGLAYSIKAHAYYNLHQLDSACCYYNLTLEESADPYSICDAFRRLSEIYSIEGHLDQASSYAEQASMWMDTIVTLKSSDEIFRALLSFPEITAPQNRPFHTIILILTFCIFVTVFLLIKKTSIQQTQPSHAHISDFENDLHEFKQSPAYNEMVLAVHSVKELNYGEKETITDTFRNSLSGLRAFIVNSASLNGHELDYCIFIMLGFKQKDYHRVFNITPSGSRNIKTRIKEKMSEDMFNYIFAPVQATDSEA